MSKFSAPESSLGYIYQIRYALFLLLREKERDDAYVRLENLDDVEVGDLDTKDLYQTKFKMQEAADLTDRSVDLWKTIRVWSELIIEEKIDLDNAILILVTSAEVSSDSIAFELTKNETEVEKVSEIVEKLIEISHTSKNQVLEPSFEAFNKLTTRQKEKLVENVFIKDLSHNFEELKESIKAELGLFLRPNQTEFAFIELQGWWFERSILNLEGRIGEITYLELTERIRHITHLLAEDNLPIDSVIRKSEVNRKDFDNRVFVKQLEMANIGEKSIGIAVWDYYRAFEQRSKWLREKLMNPQEEIEYEEKLVEDWRAKFAVIEDAADSNDDRACVEQAERFYTSFYVNAYPQVFIRPKVTEPFVTRGSCHLLSDKKEIGWHPFFAIKLK